MLAGSTKDQRFCTACAFAAIAAFLIFAFVLDPTWPDFLNPFGSLDCGEAAYQNAGSQKQSTQSAVAPLDGGKSEIKKDASEQCTTEGCAKSNSTLNDRYACQLAIYTRKLAWFTLLLASATIMLGGIGVWQGRLTKRSIDLAADTARQDLRAYVFIKGFERVAKLTSDGTAIRAWRINPVWENGGATPTKHMRAHICAQIVKTSAAHEGGDMPEDFDFPDTASMDDIDEAPDTPSSMALGPKATAEGEPVVIHVATLFQVWQGKKRLFLWGWADYDDRFRDSPRHRTEFCVELFFRGDPSKGDFFGIRHYRRHNGFDDECRRKPQPYEAKPGFP